MSFELEGHLEFGLDCLTVVGNGTTGLVLEVVGADVESQTRSNRVRALMVVLAASSFVPPLSFSELD